MTRIAVYTDHTYRREGDRLFVDRAFPLFLVELARHLDRLVIAGKVDPRPGRSHYELPPEIGFAELPYFKSVTRPISAAYAMGGALRRFWRALSDVDGVWLFGPHPLSIAFVAIAVSRGRRVTLGVRQDFPRYVRARHPRRRSLWAAGDLMEALWRALARRLGTIVVGPELAARYPTSDTMEVSISLVSETEILPTAHAGPSWEEEELRVLSVGRLEQEKNPLLLVEVLARLLVADPRWRLIVCGEGPLEADMRRRAEEFGVAERLTLRGYVAQDGG
ncbi:MAG: glycosyltransferase, partial [Trebonia sp.]